MTAASAPISPPISKVSALRKILESRAAGTQDELREQLGKLGFEVTQSTVSRTLRKLGAVKSTDERGRTVYRLPAEVLQPPPAASAVAELVTDMVTNGSIIVLRTPPGTASLVARHLDHLRPGGILGTLAGDDTVFIAPGDLSAIPATMSAIRKTLSEI